MFLLLRSSRQICLHVASIAADNFLRRALPLSGKLPNTVVTFITVITYIIFEGSPDVILSFFLALSLTAGSFRLPPWMSSMMAEVLGLTDSQSQESY